MTTKSDFSEEEWSRIVRAPFVAGLAISLADPSGPIEAAKAYQEMIAAGSVLIFAASVFILAVAGETLLAV